jgi:hypothetical protein
MPRQFTPVLLELYYLETARVDKRLSQCGNAITRDLGFRDQDMQAASRQINAFLIAPSLEMELATLQANGLAVDARIERYLEVACLIDRHPILKKLLFASLNKKKLTRERFISLFANGELKEWIEIFR